MSAYRLPELLGQASIAFLTLDTLRFDVAQQELQAGNTPNLAALLPEAGWERRHSPGSFTYAAHCAFFAGFLPTPARPGRHERLFALRFAGSETTGGNTVVFDEGNIVAGLAGAGYRTICIGGVGFFRKQNALSNQLPALFAESYWEDAFGVTCPDSTANQFALATRLLAEPDPRPPFLFINVSALHQPNCHYLPGAQEDSLATHAAALRYIDSQLPALLAALRRRGPCLLILASDHGTCYGEDGYVGHRLGHEQVFTVPYAEVWLEASHEPA